MEWDIYQTGFETVIISDPASIDTAVIVATPPSQTDLRAAGYVSAALYQAAPFEHREPFLARVRGDLAAAGTTGQYFFVVERAGFWERNIRGNLLAAT